MIHLFQASKKLKQCTFVMRSQDWRRMGTQMMCWDSEHMHNCSFLPKRRYCSYTDCLSKKGNFNSVQSQAYRKCALITRWLQLCGNHGNRRTEAGIRHRDVTPFANCPFLCSAWRNWKKWPQTLITLWIIFSRSLRNLWMFFLRRFSFCLYFILVHALGKTTSHITPIAK